MKAERVIHLRIPIESLVEEIRKSHGIKEPYFDVQIQADSIVLLFKARSGMDPSRPASPGRGESGDSDRAALSIIREEPMGSSPTNRTRRRSSKRNRMKTRDWPVVAKIQTSRGQTAIIYKPLVDALERRNLTPIEQRRAVARVLRSNGNDPSGSSVEYFLNSTMEYLEQQVKRSPKEKD